MKNSRKHLIPQDQLTSASEDSHSAEHQGSRNGVRVHGIYFSVVSLVALVAFIVFIAVASMTMM